MQGVCRGMMHYFLNILFFFTVLWLIMKVHVSCPISSEGFLCIFAVIGYAIFRGSNSQKDRFRTDPNADEFQGNSTKYKVETNT